MQMTPRFLTKVNTIFGSLYLITNFCQKTNPRDRELDFTDTVFFLKNVQFLTKVNQVPAYAYCEMKYSN